MRIDVPGDLQPFVEEEFATGRYSSREEVLIRALQWFREERRQAVVGIREGLVDAAAGRMQPLADAMADIRREFGAAEPK